MRFGKPLLFIVAAALDQWTKHLARVRFSLPDREPDYFKVQQILGEWVQFRLVYNTGAAFGMKPQNYLPFLNPTSFYVIFSAIAIVVLSLYYRKLKGSDAFQKYGVVLILSGAFGNLIDRLTMGKVTDFIDAGIPGMTMRWPTFNVADSCVCVGVGMILLAPLLVRQKPGALPAGDSHLPAGSPAQHGESGAGS